MNINSLYFWILKMVGGILIGFVGEKKWYMNLKEIYYFLNFFLYKL